MAVAVCRMGHLGLDLDRLRVGLEGWVCGGSLVAAGVEERSEDLRG